MRTGWTTHLHPPVDNGRFSRGRRRDQSLHTDRRRPGQGRQGSGELLRRRGQLGDYGYQWLIIKWRTTKRSVVHYGLAPDSLTRPPPQPSTQCNRACRRRQVFYASVTLTGGDRSFRRLPWHGDRGESSEIPAQWQCQAVRDAFLESFTESTGPGPLDHAGPSTETLSTVQYLPAGAAQDRALADARKP